MKLKIQVSEASARLLSRHGVLTTGMVGAQVEFVFDEAWDGLQKTAVFRAGKLVKPVENINSTANIPVEVLQKASETLEVGVYGCSEDGELVIPTVYVKACTIYDGAEPSGSISEVIPVYIGLKNSIGNLEKLYTSAKDSLVSAINQLWTTIRDEYLPIKGGKITGPINTRDVHIGGDVDPVTGEWSPDAGDGSSKVDVSGSMTVYGKTKHLASMDTRDVRVGGAYDAHGKWGPRNPHIVDHTPVGESVKNGLYISTMTIQEADRYHLILPEGSNYLYKMQITEGDRTRVFDVDQMPVIAAGTYSDEYWYDVGDDIGVIFSAKTRVDSSTKTFDDGFVGHKRLNFQKETEYVDDNPDYPYPAVGFYIYGPAEVKIWWVAGADNRFFAIKSEKRSGASRLDVSGNFVAHGNAEVKNTLSTRHLKVEGKAEINGGVYTPDDIDVDGTANVGNDLNVEGAISCGESLHMNGNDIDGVQSIEVAGTSNFNGDVRIRPNTNRDAKVKLSDSLNEALGYNFKNRVYVNEMYGATFAERLQNAIDQVDDGGVVCISSGEYILDQIVTIPDKSIILYGESKEKAIVTLSNGGCFNTEGASANLSSTIRIKNLKFVGTDSVMSFQFLAKVLTYHLSVTLENCVFENCSFNILSAESFEAMGCVFTNTAASAGDIFRKETASGYKWVSTEVIVLNGCEIETSVSNIFMLGQSGDYKCSLRISNSSLRVNSTSKYLIRCTGYGAQLKGLIVSNSYIYVASQYNSAAVTAITNVEFLDTIWSNSGTNPTNFSKQMQNLYVNRCTGITFSGNITNSLIMSSNPEIKVNSSKVVTQADLETALGSYITDVAALVGGDA